jgi:capsular exopolysaccharide synthesis family protein
MSRIFDALQRLESESSGSDSSAPPQSAELLQRVEQRAASAWEKKASHAEPEAVSGKSNGHVVEEAERLANSTLGVSVKGETLTAEDPKAVLKGLPELPVTSSVNEHLVCLTDRDSPTAEAVRLLGVRLRALRRIRPLKKVLITSTIPREGKSTIAANLACALGHGCEEKVLLVEGDVRLPVLLPMFGAEKVPGLCDSLQEDNSLLKNIYHIKEARIWILPAGSVLGNPLELLQSPKLPQLMDKLSEIFDWIIIDSPPVLPLADTSIWMRLADGILLVTRQGVTEKRPLQKGLEVLEPQKMLGALLNSTIASAYSTYYYRGSRDS